MRLRYFPILSSVLFIPCIAYGNDNFVYSRENVPQMIFGTPDARDVTVQSGSNTEQAEVNDKHPQPVKTDKVNYAQGDSGIPETPAGWDSLTTGTSNGGGVLGSQGGLHGTGGFGGNVNSQIMSSNLPQNIFSGITTPEASGGILGGSAEGADGVSSARERAMYAAFLKSLLQFVQSQPDAAPVTSSLGTAQTYGAMPAYNARPPYVANHPAAAAANSYAPARDNMQSPQPWK